MNRYSLPIPEQFSTCPDSAYHPYSRCTRARLSDGALLTQDRSPADEKRPSGAAVLTTLLTHKDGTQVFVSQAPGATGSPTTGESPLPLTAKALAAIAGSPAWKPVLSATPVPRTALPGTSLVPRMTGRQITDTIADLLPPALRTDGLRVVITAVNAPAYQLPASRAEPVLTTRQLQRIALASAWRRAATG